MNSFTGIVQGFYLDFKNIFYSEKLSMTAPVNNRNLYKPSRSLSEVEAWGGGVSFQKGVA